MADVSGDLPAIVFDFDGTLADSLAVELKALFELLKRQDQPPADVSHFRGMSMTQILRELHIPWWQALLLKEKVHNLMRDRMDDIGLMPGVDEMVRLLVQTNRLFIVSSNDSSNVRLLLGRFQVGAYITKVYDNANPLRKVKVLRRLVKENHLIAGDTWYIGDQAWDIKAAHKAGMKAAAVTWGFSNLRALGDAHPDLTVNTPDELIKHFMKPAGLS